MTKRTAEEKPVQSKGVASRSCPKTFDFSSCETFNALPLDHKRFILEYLKTYNAKQSYLKFYKCTPKVAETNASRLLRNAQVQKAFQEVSAILLQGDVASSQELREYWTKILRGSITDVCTWNGDAGLLFNKDSDEMDRDTARLIKKVKVTEKTSQKGDWTECKTEFELHDPLKASELLGRTHGMFVDKTEVELKGDITVLFEVQK
jgi:phage terminase small subunit